MRRFFKGRSFRIMVILTALIIAVSITVGVIKTQSPQTSIIGTIVSPIQSAASSVREGIAGFFDTFTQYDALEKENEQLRKQIRQLEKEKIGWQEDLQENQFYKQFYDIKEDNPDYQMISAKVISRDTSDVFGTFTVNVGSLDGVTKYDTVITPDGLVGYVSAVAPTYATVITILSPDLKVGVNDARTGDTGIVTGDTEQALEGHTLMSNISRTGSVAEGDFVVTSGSGLFPKGLVIGNVSGLEQNENDELMHAVVVPAADIFRCTNVMVITSFEGQTLPEEMK